MDKIETYIKWGVAAIAAVLVALWVVSTLKTPESEWADELRRETEKLEQSR